MYTVRIHKCVKYRSFLYNWSISIYCKNVKKNIYILYLDYVLFIWGKLDVCVYIHLSYCKAKLK